MSVKPESQALSEIFEYVQNKTPPNPQIEDFAQETGKEIYILILTGLAEFNRTEANTVRNFLNQSEILIEKNLNSHARKMLIKAKKIAAKMNNQEFLYEITEWEQTVDSQAPPTEENRKIMEGHFKKLHVILQLQTETFHS